MIPAVNRLKKRTDFERVIRKGSFFSFDDITLKILENKLKITRIGFLAGKKAASKAVRRNEIKRLVRHAFGRHIADIKPGFDIVVACRSKENQKKKFCFSDEEALKSLKKARLFQMK